jgi:nucleoside-diphosphate-sugar epimerase
MPCVSLRLTNTYGPRQHLRGNKQGFAGIFIRKAIDGEPITIFGDGSQKRDFNYIDDVVEACLLAALAPRAPGHHVYNLGHPRSYSLLEFVELLHCECDFESACQPFPDDHKAIDIGDYYADFRRFQELTAWTPQVDLAEGLHRTVAYFRPRAGLYW